MQLLRPQSLPDSSPIADLYQRYASVILTYIRRHVPSREDAEDVLLDVFIAALESDGLTKLGEHEQLAWLRRIAHNKYIDYHRRASRRPVVPLDKESEALYDDEDLAPEQRMLRQEEHTLLRTRLSSLPDLQQEVLRLRFVNDMRCSEVARHLDKNEGPSARCFRAL